jgi:branched-chain amino acid transport system substrate-binding protein
VRIKSDLLCRNYFLLYTDRTGLSNAREVVPAVRGAVVSGGLEDGALAEAARRLRCTTFFGRFELGENGRQVGHQVLVVQWQEGMKAVVWPPSQAETAVAL